MPTSSMMRIPPTASTSFCFFSLCGGRASTWTFTPRSLGAHQALDDDRILVALVLHPQGMLGLVDELANPLPPVADAPDQV